LHIATIALYWRQACSVEEHTVESRPPIANPSDSPTSGTAATAGRFVACLAALALTFPIAGIAAMVPADPGAKAAAKKEEPADPDRFFRSIVKVQTRAIRNARSIATLGAEREGTGIVISDDGLILTIGYLIVEADEVTLVDQQGRTLPARVVGYDHASGLGIVRAVVPLDAPPLPFGDSAKLAEREPVMIVNHTGAGDVTLAYVVSKRAFTGNWEYLLEQAIFTAPPTMNWSGAALISKDLKLVGVGSLIVREASSTEDGAVPGNMFVPIDVLKPILAELVKSGRRAGNARPWLGVAADEVSGRLVVTRVSPGSPGEEAGITVGDIILGVGGDGVRTQAEFYKKVWGRGDAGVDIPLRVLQGIEVKDLAVHSIDRVDYFRPRTTY